jgi:hypothetical protein
MAKLPWYIITDNFDKKTGEWTFHTHWCYRIYHKSKLIIKNLFR